VFYSGKRRISHKLKVHFFCRNFSLGKKEFFHAFHCVLPTFPPLKSLPLPTPIHFFLRSVLVGCFLLYVTLNLPETASKLERGGVVGLEGRVEKGPPIEEKTSGWNQ
jgi:hypothetical protein